MLKYTALFTSCDRHDLLRETLITFASTCDQPPLETYIVEDSALPEPEWLREISGLGKVTWVSNGQRCGQLFSCDRLWSLCKTEWAFWCEDDWRFTEHLWLEKSYAIMAPNPDIFTVNIRSDWHHPLVVDPKGRGFKIAEPGWCGGWGGFSFNPGLRRKSDYERIGGYGVHGSYSSHGFQNELALSQLYMAMGYTVASLTTGHTHHIGGGRSRAVEQLRDVGAGLPRLLIAIPVCHIKQYGRWESGQNGWPYLDGIHTPGPNDARIQAVRDTWARDLAPFAGSVDLRFFYGAPPEGAEFVPEADEVLLPVPDDYEHLPHKVQAICRYAVENNYDYLFKCDDDTAVYVDRLVTELLGRPFEYAGYVNSVNECSGGPGYFLSQRAARLVGNSGNPEQWAEDKHTAAVLARRDIYPARLVGHIPGFEKHWYWPDGFDGTKLDENTVAVHAVKPADMHAWYAHKNDTRRNQNTPSLCEVERAETDVRQHAPIE